MTAEIKYEVVGTGPGTITVRFSLGQHHVDMGLPYAGEDDVDEFIKRFVPRQQLAAMGKPVAAYAALIGKTGTADLELPKPKAVEPMFPPEPAPATAPAGTTPTS